MNFMLSDREGWLGKERVDVHVCFSSVFFALFSLFELIVFFVMSGASGLSSDFASSNLHFTPRLLLLFSLLAVFTVECSALLIGTFYAAFDHIWECVRHLLGGVFDVSFALL